MSGPASIGMRLKEIGKSKADLARAMKLPPDVISKIVSGTRAIAVAEVRPLAEFLDWPVGWVLDIAEAHRKEVGS